MHTVAAGYVTGSVFVLGISALLPFEGPRPAFAKRSFAVAVGFGLAAALSVIVLGDESGYTLGDVQKVKLAAIEAEWQTEPAPAAFTLFGLPSRTRRSTEDKIQIPWLMGVIATRSLDKPVDGLSELMVDARRRIRSGMIAYDGLDEDSRPATRRRKPRPCSTPTPRTSATACCSSSYIENPAQATDADVKAAVKTTIPTVSPLFWSFRIMVGLGFLMLFVFAPASGSTPRTGWSENRWYAAGSRSWRIPAPWIACETGWFVAEFGRQPWAIGEVLADLSGDVEPHHRRPHLLARGLFDLLHAVARDRDFPHAEVRAARPEFARPTDAITTRRKRALTCK